MNTQALLALIADLYAQLQQAHTENEALRALAEQATHAAPVSAQPTGRVDRGVGVPDDYR